MPPKGGGGAERRGNGGADFRLAASARKEGMLSGKTKKEYLKWKRAQKREKVDQSEDDGPHPRDEGVRDDGRGARGPDIEERFKELLSTNSKHKTLVTTLDGEGQRRVRGWPPEALAPLSYEPLNTVGEGARACSLPRLRRSDVGFTPEGLRLGMPERPDWRGKDWSADELQSREESDFLRWVGRLEAYGSGRVSHFEGNLEYWRQLWRVTERSQVVLMLVDARCPLLHFPAALYAKVEREGKAAILLMNKADLVPLAALEAWREWFGRHFPSLAVVWAQAGGFYRTAGPLVTGAREAGAAPRGPARGRIRQKEEQAAMAREAARRVLDALLSLRVAGGEGPSDLRVRDVVGMTADEVIAASQARNRPDKSHAEKLRLKAEAKRVQARMRESYHSVAAKRAAAMARVDVGLDGEAGVAEAGRHFGWEDDWDIRGNKAKKKAVLKHKRRARMHGEGHGRAHGQGSDGSEGESSDGAGKHGHAHAGRSRGRGNEQESGGDRDGREGGTRRRGGGADDGTSDDGGRSSHGGGEGGGGAEGAGEGSDFWSEGGSEDGSGSEALGQVDEEAERDFERLGDGAEGRGSRSGGAGRGDGEWRGPVVVAVVGEPNVGKSSTINALLGAHRVAVSSHPGKTKHYQTHYMTPTLMLCDCPGVVFPKLDVPLPIQVVFGCYRIASVRDPVSVAKYLAERHSPRIHEVLRLSKAVEDSSLARHLPDGEWSAAEVCEAVGARFGWRNRRGGVLDAHRAANWLLRAALAGRSEVSLAFLPPPD